MSDSKVYMFPEQGNSNLMSMLAPLLTLRNFDPAMLAMMNNGGFGNNSFMWVIFLFFLMGWGGDGFGFGGRRNGQGFDPQMAGLANQLNNDSGRELLMQAINGNGEAVRQLASTLNCDINAIQGALNSLQSSVCSVGNLVGMSSQQVINAILSGNCLLGNQLAQCCCNIQDAITRQGYENRLATVDLTNTLQSAINTVSAGLERGFSSVAYETQRLTCDLQNSIKDATETIIAGLRAAELREMQNKIDALRELNSLKDVVINNGQLTAMFNQMILSATAPLAGALSSLQGDVNGIKCKLPETVTLPFSCATAVPTTAFYGYNGFGINGYGLNGWGNCNNSLWG